MCEARKSRHEPALPSKGRTRRGSLVTRCGRGRKLIAEALLQVRWGFGSGVLGS